MLVARRSEKRARLLVKDGTMRVELGRNGRLLLRFAANAVLELAGKAGLRWAPKAAWATHDHGLGRESRCHDRSFSFRQSRIIRYANNRRGR